MELTHVWCGYELDRRLEYAWFINHVEHCEFFTYAVTSKLVPPLDDESVKLQVF